MANLIPQMIHLLRLTQQLLWFCPDTFQKYSTRDNRTDFMGGLRVVMSLPKGHEHTNIRTSLYR